MSETGSKPVWVIIPAAGVGKRMKSDTPKQYLKINHKTIIEHTLKRFIKHPKVSGVIVALSSEDEYWNDLKIDHTDKPLYTVEGGEERSDTVMNALEYLLVVEKLPEDSWVMVHDAARPCVSDEDINALLVIRESDCVGGILATPVRDTMKRSQPDSLQIAKTEDRDNLWHALTPQMFRLGELNQALQHCLDKFISISDESSAMEAIGKTPLIVEGSGNNVKITHPEDLQLASWLLTKEGNL
ncbi:MAG: 2-C-methyl-D-erythritol 4-phosphate cytidylyltransferase [Cocleimonas sp.]